MTKEITTIDEYIDQHSKETQEILEKIRKLIKKIAPDAKELISYKMPVFDLNGHRVYFAAFKKHIGFYAIGTDTELEEELTPYRVTKDTIQFLLDQPIPYNLIEKIVRYKILN